jgi:hypothetical protein
MTIKMSTVVTAIAIAMNVALACLDLMRPSSPESLYAALNLAAIGLLRAWRVNFFIAMAFVLYLILNMTVNVVIIGGIAHGGAWGLLLVLAPSFMTAGALFMSDAEEPAPRRSDRPAREPSAAIESAMWR